MKNILIDLTAFRPNLGGLTRAAFDLLKIINKIDLFNFYIVYNKIYCEQFFDFDNLKKIELTYPVKLSFVINNFVLAKIVKDYDIDFVHFEINPPIISNYKFSSTIHDLYFLEKNDIIKGNIKSILMNCYWRLSFKNTKINAKCIKVISKETKKSLEKYIPSHKIYLIYNFVSFKKITFSHLLNEPIKILFVGNQVPRKNVFFLLNSLINVSRKFNLFLIGTTYQYVVNKFKEYDYKINNLGFIDNDLKEEFLNSSDLLVIPSLNEGFCYPIFEALDKGLLVFGASNSSLLEFLPKECLFDLDNTYQLSIMIDKLDNKLYSTYLTKMYEHNSFLLDYNYEAEYKDFFKICLE
jgi:hypothetical protein